MNLTNHDIRDTEIRVVSKFTLNNGEHPDASPVQMPEDKHHKKAMGRKSIIWIALVCAAALAVALTAILTSNPTESPEPAPQGSSATTPAPTAKRPDAAAAGSRTPSLSAEPTPHTACLDTIIVGIPLTILTPIGGTPTLHLAGHAICDTNAILTVRAADIRADNGGIVSACIINGELLSKGENKAGYCAIINGVITIGAADSTPLFEQALTEGGDFFRQYPLVVGGQPVENKPKGASLRKALAQWQGKTVVIASQTRLAMNQFAQTLAALGVRNAIYLPGSTSPLCYTDNSQVSHTLPPTHSPNSVNPNLTFLSWIK